MRLRSRFYSASMFAAISASVVIWISPAVAYWNVPYYAPMPTYPVYYVPIENNMPTYGTQTYGMWSPNAWSSGAPVSLSSFEPSSREVLPTVDSACDLLSEFSNLEITITGKPSPDTLRHDEQTICEALTQVPSDHAETLKNLTIKYEGKKTGEDRAQAGGQLMYIAGDLPELYNVFLHELGHNIDTGMLQGTHAAGKSIFSSQKLVVYSDDPSLDFYTISWKSETKLRGSSKSNFVSGYALVNPQEDFAESYMMYITQGATFRAWAAKNTVLKRKYEWLRDTLFDGQEYFTGSATTDTAIASSRPWDATKL